MQNTPPVEAALGRLVAGLEFDAIPADALAGARRLMQDQLALQVGCEALPWSRAVVELGRARHAPGSARVVVTGDAMSPADAAFVNATLGHSFEYDDAHRASSSHPGSCVVSTALAIGEQDGLTLRDVLLGVVAGYEAYTRIGVLAAPDLLETGYHPHAMLSPFGAAAVVARMRGFDVERTTHALAIAMSHCGGTTEYTSSGGSVKRLHAGIGTRGGVQAAEMAEAGITGPTSYLTGSKGFFGTFLRRDPGPDAAEAFSPDRPFEVGRVWIKPYCCCGCCHAYVDGARELAAPADKITGVELAIQAGADVVVGNRNANSYAPQNIVNLQYSLPFQVAFALTGHGNGFSTHFDYLEGRLKLTEDGDGAEVAQLAQRVRITPNPELDAGYPGKWVGDITVTYADGTSAHRFVEDSSGTVENPISRTDLDAKFRDLTVGRLGAAGGEELLRTITDGDLDMPASALADQLIVRTSVA
ncbi:2-methylcitrate dehydratase PrpD [Pseudonocardia endophytica]|uniref:2-methylcitrate dehydratase PrpD n=2 Tax=Pseudonocardia endophytica TaxID=401976 RepID=A0A4V2PIS0_PSEEN|nr:2-methylcitrate dehydratase PrpD [Pseudonocardia endophytica]